eukprot:17711_5
MNAAMALPVAMRNSSNWIHPSLSVSISAKGRPMVANLYGATRQSCIFLNLPPSDMHFSVSRAWASSVVTHGFGRNSSLPLV